jgi:hypothetical protein
MKKFESFFYVFVIISMAFLLIKEPLGEIEGKYFPRTDEVWIVNYKKVEEGTLVWGHYTLKRECEQVTLPQFYVDFNDERYPIYWKRNVDYPIKHKNIGEGATGWSMIMDVGPMEIEQQLITARAEYKCHPIWNTIEEKNVKFIPYVR